ncbi:glutamate 5-kinase [Aliiglaciecola sp. CAU 1673]|uniref:glutamate 5-kinase n=1 Tax=Aliiglaciecola sp. CAU 1673 TaxID=3032595 RepID=UPI0023DBD985|nr:glutamate 5-kinase [Aliiglaciecola sp. CAU 1673]MDF2180295.1 glutamate 5-kinase [Aliiglaciecola sp. CAU 1673]
MSDEQVSVQQKFNWQRAVIKVGSALIAPDGKDCRTEHLLSLAQFINHSRAKGREVILVSSGAVAAGRSAMPLPGKSTMAQKQAMAAVGQTRMMANWARLFDFPTAQLLMTHGDIRDRDRYLNIKNTVRELLTFHILPIINENDTVATDELKFGDNDNLAALVALVAEADTLFICTDVDGLYDADPRRTPDAKLFAEVSEITPQIMQLGGGSGSSVGTGGMQTKLQAAKKAAANGIQTLIVNGHKASAFELLGKDIVPGTRFLPKQSRSRAKKEWLRHSLKAKGKIWVDKGACDALLNKGASLLPVGVVKTQGQFSAGDAVEIWFQEAPIATGLSLYDAPELEKISGKKSAELEGILGFAAHEVVVHRDDLVII